MEHLNTKHKRPYYCYFHNAPHNHLVGLSSKEQVLVVFVGGLDALLVGRHEPVARLCALLYLWVLNLWEFDVVTHSRVDSKE